MVVREIDHPEGPHQLRVGLRRLRSVFSVYASVLNSPEAARIADEAKWLGQEVGRLRDTDVLANDIVRREAGYHPHELELSALADALSRQALEMRKPLRDCLVGARTQKLLIDLARFVETGGWLNREDTDQPERLIAPIGALAEKALRKRWKKVSKRAHGFEALNVNERHELRKELKKLRYGAEFFASLYPAKRVFPFIKRLQKLQAAFGDLNDAAMAKALLTGAETSLAEAPQMQRAAGWVIGASQVRAESSWAGVKLLWQKLEHTRAFWR
ncbi:CHAD domain-containing protein [Mesorhizobium zhangyense]|uniref:CHAD domain-containing protein n=1 Tax=Mesorhizobium zhangyense TaxID=1776730 RepID=UPI0028AF5345|nr:CHAD domain-containing protein [Mesorhizobium zhangyense]